MPQLSKEPSINRLPSVKAFCGFAPISCSCVLTRLSKSKVSVVVVAFKPGLQEGHERTFASLLWAAHSAASHRRARCQRYVESGGQDATCVVESLPEPLADQEGQISRDRVS